MILGALIIAALVALASAVLFRDWCWKRIHRFGEILCLDKMPVWLSLLSSALAGVAAALATYHYAPDLNAKFEATKTSSQYVIENLKLLNADTSELVSSLGVYNRVAIRDGKLDPELRNQIERRISALHWRALEYDILFTSPESKQVLARYRRALDALGAAIDGKQEDVARSVSAGRELAEASHELMRLLTKKADIREAFRSW